MRTYTVEVRQTISVTHTVELFEQTDYPKNSEQTAHSEPIDAKNSLADVVPAEQTFNVYPTRQWVVYEGDKCVGVYADGLLNYRRPTTS